MSKIQIEFVLDNGLTGSGVIEQDDIPAARSASEAGSAVPWAMSLPARRNRT